MKTNQTHKWMPLLAALMVGTGCLERAPAAEGVLPRDGQTIAFLGDSITAYGWGYPGGYIKLVVDGLSKEGVNVTPIPAGVGGNTSRDMLARLDKDVLSRKPDWMTLSCGVNDVWHGAGGVDLESYKKNITEIVDRAQARGIKVVILTSTPIGEEPNGNNAKLAAYNDFLRAFAKERRLPLADLSASFHRVLDPLPVDNHSRYLTVDGVHMNPDGNALMAKGVLEAFGVSPAEVARVEQGWLGEKDTAVVGNYPYDPRPRLGITLGQYRAIAKVAERNKTNTVDMVLSVWLQCLAEAVQAHRQDAILNAEQIKKEAQDILARKIGKLDLAG